jgi:diacylglycerol kinase (ATP)
MLNKPKHNLFRNGMYAIEGLIDITKNETSFKWQIAGFIVFGIISWVLPIEFVYKAILFGSLFVMILSEIVNSAIERVVDLVTQDYHILAKQAKDAGAAIVLISLIFVLFVWVATLLVAFGLV